MIGKIEYLLLPFFRRKYRILGLTIASFAAMC